MTLRLRQICLVAPQLAPVAEAIESILGLPVCHRDPAVGKYGLENALFVCGHQFLEVVAPTRDGTTAGRYLQRSGGRGGYMAIFDTHDPERRRAHAEALGIRIAHVMDYPAFFGIQLHPADCRATMLEFDRSEGNEQLDGAYWPAGPHWHVDAAQAADAVEALPGVPVRASGPVGTVEPLVAFGAIELQHRRAAIGRVQLDTEERGVVHHMRDADAQRLDVRTAPFGVVGVENRHVASASTRAL